MRENYKKEIQMANYTKKFTKPYANGYKDRPDTSTPVTADIKNAETDALLAIEEYLANNAISSVSANIGNSTGVYIATIRINDVDYRIYTPMVRYTSEITEGTKVGTLTFGNYSFDVYAPAVSAGSSVSVTPKATSGTNIAEITVDGTTYQLYAPTGSSGSTVTAEATLTEGTQIGKITIDGKETVLYAPTAIALAVDTELSATSENPVQNKVVTAELDKKLEVLGDDEQAPDAVKFVLDSELSLTSENGVKNKTIAQEFENYATGVKMVAKAEEAETAQTAGSATTAETATKAAQDRNGNVIDDTYAKKTEIPEGGSVSNMTSDNNGIGRPDGDTIVVEYDGVFKLNDAQDIEQLTAGISYWSYDYNSEYVSEYSTWNCHKIGNIATLKIKCILTKDVPSDKDYVVLFSANDDGMSTMKTDFKPDTILVGVVKHITDDYKTVWNICKISWGVNGIFLDSEGSESYKTGDEIYCSGISILN